MTKRGWAVGLVMLFTGLTAPWRGTAMLALSTSQQNVWYLVDSSRPRVNPDGLLTGSPTGVFTIQLWAQPPDYRSRLFSIWQSSSSPVAPRTFMGD